VYPVYQFASQASEDILDFDFGNDFVRNISWKPAVMLTETAAQASGDRPLRYRADMERGAPSADCWASCTEQVFPNLPDSDRHTIAVDSHCGAILVPMIMLLGILWPVGLRNVKISIALVSFASKLS
jgi:hypothetical protein